MTKAHNLAGLGIGQVRTLAKIAAAARERQVVSIVGAAVLLRDDVLDVMSQFTRDLAQAAAFAPLAGPAADEALRSASIRYWIAESSCWRALRGLK